MLNELSQWIKNDGTDRVPPAPVVPVHPLRVLALIAACYDAADASHEDRYGILADQFRDADDIEDSARVLAYRIMSAADREPRALHTFFHMGETSGDADPASPAPDGYTRTVAATRQERTRKGTTVKMVTVHGRAYVNGSLTARPSGACSMSADRLTYALSTVPRTVLGHADAVSLTMLTDIAYPDIPRLIGADVLSFAEFSAWDDIRAATPRKGMGTRYRLPTVHTRATEAPTTVTYYDGQTVTRLIAPDADPAYAWNGHTRYMRPETVRATRAARRRVYRSVTVPTGTDLAHALGDLAAVAPVGARVAWTADGYAGTLTVTGSDKARRFSVTGLPSPVRGTRTPRGVVAAVARATA